jgi:hypothetical protein
MNRQDLRNQYPFHTVRVNQMKITAINPGRVYPPIQGQDKWTYSIEYNFNPTLSRVVACGYNYDTATEAKQKMREEVNRLRIKHGLINNWRMP